MRDKAVVIISGGMDSTVLAYMMAEKNDLTLLSFDYGQRHYKELAHAHRTSDKLGVPHYVVALNVSDAFDHGTFSLGAVLGDSSLVSEDTDVPEGHYADETMKATVVPNRNMMMLSIGAAVAIGQGAKYVATGVHAGDHAIYPDCRPEFIDAMNKTIQLANEGFLVDGFKIEAPFVTVSKTDIVGLGHTLGVPWEDTWSCYKGEGLHCGKCGTCVERIEAFTEAGIYDPTVYGNRVA